MINLSFLCPELPSWPHFSLVLEQAQYCYCRFCGCKWLFVKNSAALLVHLSKALILKAIVSLCRCYIILDLVLMCVIGSGTTYQRDNNLLKATVKFLSVTAEICSKRSDKTEFMLISRAIDNSNLFNYKWELWLREAASGLMKISHKMSCVQTQPKDCLFLQV